MAFDVDSMDTKNTPMRWRIVGKDLVDNKPEELNALDPVYKAALEKAATFTSDNEMGVGNQPGVGSEPDPVPESVLVTGVTIGDVPSADLELGTDTEAQLSVTVLPANADDATVTWASDDEAVVTVDTTGLVTVVGIGTANVSATANDASGISDSVTITVVDIV